VTEDNKTLHLKAGDSKSTSETQTMALKIKLLFVDDEESIRRLFREAVTTDEIVVETASDGEEALQKIKTSTPDVVVTDVRMPRMDGLTLLNEIKTRFPDIFVVVVTAHGTIEDAVSAIKEGAYDYILKPFDFEMIMMLIEKIKGHRRILADNFFQGKKRRTGYRFENIIGQAPNMFRIFQKVVDVAKADATVLINGESGTGKELIAEAIHYNSPRKDGPLIKVNCAAFTETLINSELFGHEKAAFTGAVTQKKGHFELADTGTVFLDEIGDIPISTQVSLLRVLELGTFQRVGGTNTIKVNARFVCATNKNLSEAIRDKRFREDLFYRINVVPLEIPPLRERKSDIPLLANYYLRKYSDEINKKIKGISKGAMEILMKYDWPGNVRELANVINNVVIFCKDRAITPANLPKELWNSSRMDDFSLRLSSTSLPIAEASLIRKVLEETNWNLKQAATKLGIARGTLYGKMKKYGIEKPLKPEDSTGDEI